jgi:butyryl-CoA dehydrogenase
VLLRLAREITQAEREGKPLVLALAHTEVGGGSDVEDVDDIARARIGSRWTKVPGGYRLSARKVFISNGSIARYNIVTAYGHSQDPRTSMRGFVVAPDAPGFSVGRLEHKLGQRLSTAVEIICDDVFVPAADSFDGGDVGQTLDSTLSLTRGPVGAMAAGIIRGTIERTLEYVAQKRVNGHWLHEEQHVQLALAEMLASLQAARGLYMDASFAGEAWGVAAMMPYLPRSVPPFVRDSRLYATMMGSTKLLEQSRKLYYKLVPKPQLQRVTAHASAAKFMCSDLSVKCALQAMEILGEDANDPRWGIEKQLRDAKLGQIFEGTNQINRLHVARGMLGAAS